MYKIHSRHTSMPLIFRTFCFNPAFSLQRCFHAHPSLLILQIRCTRCFPHDCCRPGSWFHLPIARSSSSLRTGLHPTRPRARTWCVFTEQSAFGPVADTLPFKHATLFYRRHPARRMYSSSSPSSSFFFVFSLDLRHHCRDRLLLIDDSPLHPTFTNLTPSLLHDVTPCRCALLCCCCYRDRTE